MKSLFAPIHQLKANLSNTIIGQTSLIDRLIIAILVGGHLLVEGPPGVAKTSIIKYMASFLQLSFSRIQFTPDLLPSDITGSEIFNPETKKFQFFKGAIFNDIILADEINRAPAKVQSALLEAMEEQQVSIGNDTYPLSEIFMVMATQNPIEQAGTYPLPEAQLDRFLMKALVSYPNTSDELKILESVLINPPVVSPISFDKGQLIELRKKIAETYIDKTLLEYIVNLVSATRTPEKYCEEVKNYIKFGASPRASIALVKSVKALARLYDRDYATPDDVKAIFTDVCRHRLILSFEAKANNISPDWVCSKILQDVPVY